MVMKNIRLTILCYFMLPVALYASTEPLIDQNLAYEHKKLALKRHQGEAPLRAILSRLNPHEKEIFDYEFSKIHSKNYSVTCPTCSKAGVHNSYIATLIGGALCLSQQSLTHKNSLLHPDRNRKTLDQAIDSARAAVLFSLIQYPEGETWFQKIYPHISYSCWDDFSDKLRYILSLHESYGYTLITRPATNSKSRITSVPGVEKLFPVCLDDSMSALIRETDASVHKNVSIGLLQSLNVVNIHQGVRQDRAFIPIHTGFVGGNHNHPYFIVL